MSNAAVPLDPAVLQTYAQGDAAIERELHAEFLAATRADCAALRAALVAGNPVEIAQAAHRVKGSSRMIGALPQGDAAERLEHAARAGDLAAVAAATAGFEAEHLRLVAWLERLLAEGA